MRSSLFGLLLIGAAGLWPTPRVQGDDDPGRIGRGIGQQLNDFKLKNVLDGESVSLFGLRGKRAAVFVFMGTDCPVGNLYLPRIKEIRDAYKDKGVFFALINSNTRETTEEVAKHARDNGIVFPVLKDESNKVADLMLAERTCEVVVSDDKGTIRYRGAIDDQYGVGVRKQAIEHQYLRDALDAILSEQPITLTATPVAGCLIDRIDPQPDRLSGIKRVRPAAEAITKQLATEDDASIQQAGNPTYAADIASIINNRCQSCHRPGQVGPFPLLTYDDARKHSAMIREVVAERRMPPWHADPRYGHFSNDRSLTASDRGKLIAWADQGAPLGDPSKIPPPRLFADAWSIGTPDVVVEIPEPYDVAAQGTLDYVYIRVPTNFKEDKWIRMAEAQPGDRSVVHHIIVYVVPGQEPKAKGRTDGRGLGRRIDAHLCGYAPGDLPAAYPEGTAKKIPAGSDFVFQIHYTPNGKRRVDRSRVGLIFARKPVEHHAVTFGIAQPKFTLPPGDDNYKVTSQHTFKKEIRLIGFMPHMHLRGKSFEYKATYPDGRSEILLSVPAFDFGWQSAYNLAEPIVLPKGTRIDCEAHFDNSAANPANPDPTQEVRWGDQTFQEMMIGYIDFSDVEPINPAAVEKLEQPIQTGAPQRSLGDLMRTFIRPGHLRTGQGATK